MPLLSSQDRAAVQNQLASITRPVTLVFFTQTFGAPDSVTTTKQILDEVASLSDYVTVQEANFVLDKEQAAQFGIEHIPAVVVLSEGRDTRMRFIGAPAGYEFMSLVEAVVIAGTGESGLSQDAKARIAEQVTSPLELMVFVTPTCPHCPKAVTLAHRMAMESPHIRATSVEATEFLDLSRKYRVTGVPKTVVTNGTVEVMGALPEAQFVQEILKPAPPA
jgi:glutaredoxin-like protein